MDIEQTAVPVTERAAAHRALGDESRLRLVDALRLGDRTPGELAAAVGVGTNLLAHHLDVLEAVGLVHRRRSQGDGRRRYVTLDRSRLGGLLGPPPSLPAGVVVFVCTANSARSQLAARLWRRRTGEPALSAGTEPAARVHPDAVEVGRRHGLRLRAARPRHLRDLEVRPDLVVSVCDRVRESGLALDAATLHWSVPDPVGRGRHAFEDVVADLAARVDVLAEAMDVPATRADEERDP